MNRLKLIALDRDDLAVLSAHVQDAVLKVRDMDFKAREQQFTLVLRRFVWENAANGKKDSDSLERRLAVLHFDRVKKVKLSGISQSAKDAVLALLAVRFIASTDPENDPSGAIELVFAGDGTVRLEVECIESQLSDMDSSWAARAKPDHEANDQGGQGVD